MNEVMTAGWDLLHGLLVSAWALLVAVSTWGWDLLCHLHTDAPRLEGLLIGVLLAWLLLRRDRHPVLRVLSSPLKLIVDILDLAWDQAVEVVSDVLGTIKGWVNKAWNTVWGTVTGTLSWVKAKLTGGYNWLIGLLKGLKDKLSKGKEK